MPDLQRFKENLNYLKERDVALKVEASGFQTRIGNLNAKIKKEEETITDCNEITVLLTAAAAAARNNAKGHFEKIITDALQFVTQSRDYRFVIQEKNSKTKASYEFFVESTVNGIKCLQKPEDANGGGFVDIISVAAKFAYLEIFNDPKIRCNTILCDEPGKMISADMSIKFAEYLKFLGKHYGRQIIMVTHNENLANIATKTFIVTKNSNGVSHVTDANCDPLKNFASLEESFE